MNGKVRFIQANVLAAVVLAAGILAGCAASHTESFNRGVEHMEAGEYRQAETAYRRALSADPDDAETHNALGLVLARMKRDEEALASFERAAELDPDVGEYYRNMGIVLGNLERLDEAEAMLEKAESMGAGNIHYHYGRLYLLREEYDKATEHFEMELTTESPHPQTGKWLQRARDPKPKQSPSAG